MNIHISEQVSRGSRLLVVVSILFVFSRLCVCMCAVIRARVVVHVRILQRFVGPSRARVLRIYHKALLGNAAVHASLAQDIEVMSTKNDQISLHCNCKCDAWKAEVEQCSAHKNVVKHVLSFAAGSERSSPTLFSYIGAADECCKCHGEEPLRLHNVLSHRSAVV